MKGILPLPCRWAGYVLVLLSVFSPMLMYLSGMIDDGNWVMVKLGMKLVVWLSLFMIFLARQKDEDGETALLRGKSMKYALLGWGAYYAVALVKAGCDGRLEAADNGAAILFMALTVLIFEFLVKKRKADRLLRRK